MLSLTGIHDELVKLNQNVESLISIFERYLNINPKQAPLVDPSPDLAPSYYDDMAALKAELEAEAKKHVAQ
jgi:hypothetical protein